MSDSFCTLRVSCFMETIIIIMKNCHAPNDKQFCMARKRDHCTTIHSKRDHLYSSCNKRDHCTVATAKETTVQQPEQKRPLVRQLQQKRPSYSSHIPSLISLVVSMDVKHHVYLLTAATAKETPCTAATIKETAVQQSRA